MNIRLNMDFFNRRRGDVIRKGDKYYEDFKGWAERKDLRHGAVICSFVEDEAPKVDEGTTSDQDQSDPEGQADERAEEVEVKPELVCDICGYVAVNHGVLARHKTSKHKE